MPGTDDLSIGAKSALVQSDHAFRDDYGSQIIASVKRVIVYFLQTVGQLRRSQLGAALKSEAADGLQSRREFDQTEFRTGRKAAVGQFFQPGRQHYKGQRRTIPKSILSDFGYAVGQMHRRQLSAARERGFTDVGHTVGNNNRDQLIAAGKNSLVDLYRPFSYARNREAAVGADQTVSPVGQTVFFPGRVLQRAAAESLASQKDQSGRQLGRG